MDKKQEKIIEKKVEVQVEKEVRKRLRDKVKNQAFKFKQEFKKQVLISVSAALGFLIALSWREPISDAVKLIVAKMGVGENMIYYQFLSAIIVTVIAVLGLMLISKWAVEKK